MTRAFVRGACPGLSLPMETGDGLLVRLMPAAPIRLDAFIELCRAARKYGNGTIEISARGSVQIRGLSPSSAPLFAAAVAALEIDICESVPVISDPLPDDPAALVDTAAISAVLRRGLSESALQLAPKVSVIIDGGGLIDLDRLFADIRLQAVRTPEGLKFKLALAGNADSATPLGVVACDKAAETVLDLLTRIAAHGPAARAADLLAMLSPPATRANAPRARRADTVGIHALKNGALALGVALAFGHTQAESLAALARFAESNGATWTRPAPGRALLVGPFGETGAAKTKDAGTNLGFVTQASDPRRRIAACPGAPLCAQGLIAARTLAAEIARHVTLPPGDGIALHVSGCAKGCAHPVPAPLTIVGTEAGCGIVREDTARAKPCEYVRESELIPALTSKREVAHA